MKWFSTIAFAVAMLACIGAAVFFAMRDNGQAAGGFGVGAFVCLVATAGSAEEAAKKGK